MCGIVYAHNRLGQPVNDSILQQFDNQRTRGTQGFGLFDGEFGNMVHHSKEDGILKWLVKYPSNMILFHHRFPTSTVNVKRAAHPFSTGDYFGKTQYILVHNGSIRNADELFVDHAELEIEYKSLLDDLTFNDSEALLWDFALTMEGKQKEMKAYGAIALVCMKLVDGKVDRLLFARNNNPLNLYRDKNNISLSSEGAGDPIKSDVLYNYNYKLNRITTKPMDIPSFNPIHNPSSYEYKGGYSQNSGFRGSPSFSPGAYTPGSYASVGDNACNPTTTRDRRDAGSYPSIFDCNCDEIGWENCEYHGDFANDSEFTFSNESVSTDGFDSLRDAIDDKANDDDVAYEAWWKDHELSATTANEGTETPQQAGNWLGAELLRKFGSLVDAAVRAKAASKDKGERKRASFDGEVYELDEKTQLMLPIAKPLATSISPKVVRDIADTGESLSDALKRQTDRRSAENIMLIRRGVMPKDGEVESEYMSFLAGVKGHFEQAYWAIELAYEDAENTPDTVDNIRKRVILEKVLERISTDPEYDNENSISSIWEAIWQQTPATA